MRYISNTCAILRRYENTRPRPSVAGRSPSASLAKKICFSECLGSAKSLVSEGVFALRVKLLLFRRKKAKSGSEKHIFLAPCPLGLRTVFLIASGLLTIHELAF